MFDRALRLLANLKGAQAAAPDPGPAATLDGAAAVRAVEGDLVPLAQALGAAAAGARVAATLDDPRLLDEAARRLLPLVAHGDTPPAGTQAFVLVPSTVQEVADLALVARRTSELALVPGVLVHDLAHVTQDLHLPPSAFVGEPGDAIPAPTPAQRMLFGDERRRVPRRFDSARPALLGASRPDLQEAAHAYAFQEPVAPLLDEAVAALAERTGRRHDLAFGEGDLDADVIVVAAGSLLAPLKAVAARLRSSGRLKAGVVGVRCLRPFPGLRVAALLKGHRRVAVLGEALQACLPGHLPVHVHGTPREADLEALFTRLAEGPTAALHLGVRLVPEGRTPDAEIVRGQMLRAWPGLDARGVRAAGPPHKNGTAREEVPRLARRPEAARFYRQEILPGDALAADPWKALGEVPALAAAFGDVSPTRASLPVFDPAACTGCGACWPACPDGALSPLAFTAESLLEAGMTPETSALRAVAGKLTARMTRDLHSEAPPRTAGDLLCRAYEAVAPSLKADRREAADRALTAVADRLRVLPLAVLDAPEWQGARTMSIVVDPDTCQACGACVAACEPGALALQPQDAANLQHARRVRRLWEDLPDAQEPLPGLEGLYMDRRRLLAMAGADGAEPGDGAKLALRAVLAVATASWSPPDAAALRERLDASLQALLVAGLDVAEDGSLDETSLDRERLSRLVGLGRALQDLEAAGPALALTGGLPWPANPYSLPAYAGATADVAAGLAAARLADEAADLLRRAHELLGEEAPPPDPAPLLLVGPEAVLAADPGLLRLLLSDLPVKVVALADPGTPCPDTARLARALDRPFVLQSTPACPEHLLAGLEEAFRTPGPALLRLHAPSPSRDGFPADRTLQRSREAVEARVFPLWRSSPEGGLDLSGNPPEAGSPEEWAAGEARRPRVTRRAWDAMQPPPPPPPVAEPPDLSGVRAELEEEITERVRARLLALAGFEA